MRTLLIPVVFSLFSLVAAPVPAANQNTATSATSQRAKAPAQSKPSVHGEAVKAPALQQNEVQFKEPVKTESIENQPAKPSEVEYIAPTNLNDRNPISN